MALLGFDHGGKEGFQGPEMTKGIDRECSATRCKLHSAVVDTAHTVGYLPA